MKKIISLSLIFIFLFSVINTPKLNANAFDSFQINLNECNFLAPEGENICDGLKLPSLAFRGDTYILEGANQTAINQVGIEMRNNPSCKVVVVGHGTGNKFIQQLSWDRVNTVINFLVKNQQIDRERFIFIYGENGDDSLVELRVAGENEEGQSDQPAPFPNLRK